MLFSLSVLGDIDKTQVFGTFVPPEMKCVNWLFEDTSHFTPELWQLSASYPHGVEYHPYIYKAT